MTEQIQIIDPSGVERDINPEAIWEHLPDATQEPYTILDLAHLPYDEWEQGDGSD